MSEAMYREHILDLYKHPHNFGKLENAKSHTENNPLCGDEITMHIIIEKDKVKDVKFEGKGCALSMASASLITDKIKGMSLSEIKKLSKEDMLEMMMIPIGPVRQKCALLPLKTVQIVIGG